MSLFTNRQRILRWAVFSVFAAPMLLLGASLLGCFPWSPINCTHADVDIRSGRVRLTRYIFWFRARESVEDSALTRALRPEDYASSTPEWHHVITLSPGLNHSPHYFYHSAIAQIRHLESAWSLAEFTPAARRASSKRILELWQQSGGDDGAEPYLRALEGLVLAGGSDRRTIDERDLPRE